jgi:hypothetical protein
LGMADPAIFYGVYQIVFDVLLTYDFCEFHATNLVKRFQGDKWGGSRKTEDRRPKWAVGNGNSVQALERS